MPKITWTPELEQKLSEIYPDTDTRIVAEIIGGDYDAVRSRAKKLRLRKIEGFQSMPRHSIWHSVDLEEFKMLYPTTSNRVLAKKYGINYKAVKNKARHLNLKKDPDHVNEGQFKKGRVSPNKGKKCPWAPNNGNFKKGHKPHNTKYDGAITIRKNARGILYKFIRISERKWLHLHVHIWQKHNGTIPDGMIVTFRDGDTMNCTLENLKLISKKDNALRNSGSINLPDGFVAHLIAGKRYKHLKREILENKELIELKRKSIILNREINERAK